MKSSGGIRRFYYPSHQSLAAAFDDAYIEMDPFDDQDNLDYQSPMENDNNVVHLGYADDYFGHSAHFHHLLGINETDDGSGGLQFVQHAFVCHSTSDFEDYTSIHEEGHVCGLEHDTDPDDGYQGHSDECAMIYRINEPKYFCATCLLWLRATPRNQ